MYTLTNKLSTKLRESMKDEENQRGIVKVLDVLKKTLLFPMIEQWMLVKDY